MWHIRTDTVRVVNPASDYMPEQPERMLYTYETPVADGWALPDDFGTLRIVDPDTFVQP